jgi:transcriptional regulator with XRE-family HTH domain
MKIINDIIYSSDKMLLAERLAELIKASGFTPAWLHLKTGISPRSMDRLLKGRENVTDETRIKILGALGLSLCYFYNTPKLDYVLITLAEAEKIVNKYRENEIRLSKAAEAEKAE